MLLAHAAELHRPLVRAAALARSNGGSLAAFGALTLLFALLTSEFFSVGQFVGLALGTVVLVVGLRERRWGVRLLHADPLAPQALAHGELALLGALAAYALLQLTLLRPSGAELQKAVGGAAGGLDVAAMVESMTNVFYATVLAVAVLYQGGMARYYSKRSEPLERYRELPEWARNVVESML
ncbi:MAG: hypothetical protein ACT4PU_00760 [Planctomycetota bacterium]